MMLLDSPPVEPTAEEIEDEDEEVEGASLRWSPGESMTTGGAGTDVETEADI